MEILINGEAVDEKTALQIIRESMRFRQDKKFGIIVGKKFIERLSTISIPGDLYVWDCLIWDCVIIEASMGFNQEIKLSNPVSQKIPQYQGIIRGVKRSIINFNGRIIPCRKLKTHNIFNDENY
jgi:hypothetical protein